LEFHGLAHHTAGDVTDANFLGVVGEASGARKHDNVDDRKQQVMIDILCLVSFSESISLRWNTNDARRDVVRATKQFCCLVVT
jgi:hypothetical protein